MVTNKLKTLKNILVILDDSAHSHVTIHDHKAETNNEKQQKLIKFYKDRLEKVKLFHKVNTASTLINERSREYIIFAEQELEKVKNGRTW